MVSDKSKIASYDAAGEANGQRAVRPRDAATLILVRRDRGRPEVLMGQRHHSHAFMPNKFVFPGGRLDRADYHAEAAGALRPETARLLELGATPAKARALALAAIRETFEETGLRLGTADPKKKPRTSTGAWASFVADGVLPVLDVLDYIARAITPPYRSRRFDARFFMADAHHIHHADLDSLTGSGELLKLCWVTTEEAMALDLPNITKTVIRKAELRLLSPDQPHAPLFTRMIRGKAVVSELT